MFYSTVILDVTDFRFIFLEKIYNFTPSDGIHEVDLKYLDIENLYKFIIQRTLRDYFMSKLGREYFRYETENSSLLYSLIYDDISKHLLNTIDVCLEKFCEQLINRRIRKGLIIEDMQVIVTNNTIYLTLGEKE